MKKLFPLILTLILIWVVCFTGCTSQSNASNNSEWATDPSGNNVLTMYGHATTFPENLPASVTYNDTTITLQSVSLYQNEANYSHNLFLVIAIDVAQLDDSQIHWLRESDLNVSAYLTSEKNEYDFSMMSSLGNLLVEDEKIIYFVKTSSFFKDNRYDFAGSEIVISVDVTQENFSQSSNDENSEVVEQYGLNYTVLAPDTIPDAETIPNPLYNYVAKWLNELGNSYR